MRTIEITRVTIYRRDGEWCYAAWVNEEFDHSDRLCPGHFTPIQATRRARKLFPTRRVERVADV